jgi:hypothetical protein
VFDCDYTDAEWERLLHGKPGKISLKNLSGVVERDGFEGVVDTFNRIYINNETGGASEAKRDTLRRFVSDAPPVSLLM